MFNFKRRRLHLTTKAIIPCLVNEANSINNPQIGHRFGFHINVSQIEQLGLFLDDDFVSSAIRWSYLQLL